MKIIPSALVRLYPEEISALKEARCILDDIAECAEDSGVASLACVLVDCLDMMSQCYVVEKDS